MGDILWSRLRFLSNHGRLEDARQDMDAALEAARQQGFREGVEAAVLEVEKRILGVPSAAAGDYALDGALAAIRALTRPTSPDTTGGTAGFCDIVRCETCGAAVYDDPPSREAHAKTMCPGGGTAPGGGGVRDVTPHYGKWGGPALCGAEGGERWTAVSHVGCRFCLNIIDLFLADSFEALPWAMLRSPSPRGTP